MIHVAGNIVIKDRKINSTAIEIVEADYFNYRQNLIVPNVNWGFGYRKTIETNNKNRNKSLNIRFKSRFKKKINFE
jgi:hypothetical protein